MAELGEIELFQDRIDTAADRVDAIQHREESQVLLDGQVSRQRCIHRRKVGAQQRAATVVCEVVTVDLDAPASRFEHAQNHVDRRCFAGAVGTEQSDDFARGNRNDRSSTASVPP